MKALDLDLSGILVREVSEGWFQFFQDENSSKPISIPMSETKVKFCLEKLETGDEDWLADFTLPEEDVWPDSSFDEDYFALIQDLR